MANKKSSKLPAVLLALLLAVTLVVNVVLSVPLYTVMNMYFGKGDAIVEENENSANLNSNYYTSAYQSPEEMEAAAQDLAAEVESEGVVLLKNDNAALPLTDDETSVSLFGRTSVDPIYTGAGSAATESSPVDYKAAFEEAGFSVNPTLYDFYANHSISTTKVDVTMQTGMGPMPASYTGRGFLSSMGTAMFINDIIAEVPVSDYPADLADSCKTYGDAAIVILGRVGGEGCDLPVDMSEYAPREEDKDKHYLELSSIEEEMLAYVKGLKDAGTVKKIVVVLNTANTMELDFLDDAAYGIDAAIWVGCLGDQGSRGVVSVLDGDVTPSGHTVDTYVYDLTKDPSYVNFDDTFYTNVDGSIGGYESGRFNEYEEGIYVGYRYYETAAAEAMNGNYPGFDYDTAVQYPFGYGLSYTTFDMAFEGTPTFENDTFTFNVKVTNTGDTYSGKQVVQLYAEAPYTPGGIEKSKVVLVAYDKTDLLAPGESQTLTLTVNKDDLASYDYKNNGCYVLDAGSYTFYLSENAHSWANIAADDTTKCYTCTLDQEIYSGDNKRDSDAVAATNQFDEVSAMFTDTPETGKPLNMSRADFAGTFPTAPTAADAEAEPETKAELETVFDEETDPLLGNEEGSLAYAAEAPTTKADNGLSLIDLRGADYDDERWELLLDELDMSEVAPMLANAGYNTAEMLSVGKPATLDYDGPLGWSTWVSASGGEAICTGFPAEELLAATWNTDLAYQVGLMIGEQGLNNGFNGWYAPAMNTHRSAFAGRNYEYASEDGLLAGTITANEVSGAMQMGVFCYLKHFALNDKEDGRNGIATWANEQAIREIYLKPFEVCVKTAKATISYNDEDGVQQTREIRAATGIMSAYNRIGTKWSGANYGLMTQILRNEWGFDGAVVSDYFGGSAYMDTDEGLRAGNDLMLNTFADGSLTDSTSATAQTAMRKAAHNVLYMVVNSNAMQGIASGVTIRYDLAGWQKVMYACDAVVAVILIAGVALILRKKKKA